MHIPKTQPQEVIFGRRTILTASEAGKLVGVTQTTIKNWVAKHRIGYYDNHKKQYRVNYTSLLNVVQDKLMRKVTSITLCSGKARGVRNVRFVTK